MASGVMSECGCGELCVCLCGARGYRMTDRRGYISFPYAFSCDDVWRIPLPLIHTHFPHLVCPSPPPLQPRSRCQLPLQEYVQDSVSLPGQHHPHRRPELHLSQCACVGRYYGGQQSNIPSLLDEKQVPQQMKSEYPPSSFQVPLCFNGTMNGTACPSPALVPAGLYAKFP